MTFPSGASNTFSGAMTGANKFYNVEFNSAATSWTFNAAAEVAHDFTITAGTVTAPASTLTIGRNFANSGTFDANGGTVVFNNAGLTSAITGATTFNHLTCTTAGKPLRFGATQTFTIGGTLTLTGASGNLISLDRSGGSGSDQFAFSIAGAQSVDYVDVSNSQVLGSADITATNATSSGGNTDAGTTTPMWILNAGGGGGAGVGLQLQGLGIQGINVN